MEFSEREEKEDNLNKLVFPSVQQLALKLPRLICPFLVVINVQGIQVCRTIKDLEVKHQSQAEIIAKLLKSTILECHNHD